MYALGVQICVEDAHHTGNFPLQSNVSEELGMFFLPY